MAKSIRFSFRILQMLALGTPLLIAAWAQSGQQPPASDKPDAKATEQQLPAGDKPDAKATENRAGDLQAGHDEAYVIGANDVLAINVWKEPEISRSVPVRSDGKISLPLVGEMQASGQTPRQLEEEIKKRLGAYYIWRMSRPREIWPSASWPRSMPRRRLAATFADGNRQRW